MNHKFIPRARWILGIAVCAAFLGSTVGVAQFRVFQQTLPSKATQRALVAAAANVAKGRSTSGASTVPRQTVGEFAAAMATKCPSPLPTRAQLRSQLLDVVTSNKAGRLRANGPSAGSGGLDLDLWAVVVNRKGEVCVVAFSGSDAPDGSLASQQEWAGSRVIAAQKANTANSFSLPGFALSTANLFFATQNGQSLFGLQQSNPVEAATAAYVGATEDYGTDDDPMLLKKIGGINVFGGGLALYAPTSPPVLIGAIGVSGDTSCADHIAAWKLRWAMNLDNVPNGVFNRFAPFTSSQTNGVDGSAIYTGAKSDNMVVTVSNTNGSAQDIVPNKNKVGGMSSASGFGHATCGLGGDSYSYSDTGTLLVTPTVATSTLVINGLPNAYPVGAIQ